MSLFQTFWGFGTWNENRVAVDRPVVSLGLRGEPAFGTFPGCGGGFWGRRNRFPSRPAPKFGLNPSQARLPHPDNRSSIAPGGGVKPAVGLRRGIAGGKREEPNRPEPHPSPWITPFVRPGQRRG